MSGLSASARALIREGQSVLRPSALDRARVASALASRLGEAALVAAPTAATAGHWLLWQKLGALVVGAGVLGGGAWGVQQALEQPQEPARLGEVVALAPAAPPVAAPATPVDEAAAPATDEAVSVGASRARPVPAADRLAEEVAILSRATSQLRGGRPAEALRLLTEHQRRFPGGRLVEERRAAKIQALCALGNGAAAEAELSRLARSSPRSPHLARAQQACGFSKPGG
jgi:hypothetical protein